VCVFVFLMCTHILLYRDIYRLVSCLSILYILQLRNILQLVILRITISTGINVPRQGISLFSMSWLISVSHSNSFLFEVYSFLIVSRLQAHTHILPYMHTPFPYTLVHVCSFLFDLGQILDPVNIKCKHPTLYCHSSSPHCLCVFISNWFIIHFYLMRISSLFVCNIYAHCFCVCFYTQSFL